MDSKPMTKTQVAKMRRFLEKELDGRECFVLMETQGGEAITAGQMDPIDAVVIVMSLLYEACDNNAFIAKLIAKRCIKHIKHLDKKGELRRVDDR